MEPLAATARTAYVERLARERFDVLVIGGGITGAGVPWTQPSRATGSPWWKKPISPAAPAANPSDPHENFTNNHGYLIKNSRSYAIIDSTDVLPPSDGQSREIYRDLKLSSAPSEQREEMQEQWKTRASKITRSTRPYE